MEKTFPKVGDPLYLRQFTGHYYVDIVKHPYTVVAVNKSEVLVQECKLIAPIYHCIGNPYLDRPDLRASASFSITLLLRRLSLIQMVAFDDSPGTVVEVSGELLDPTLIILFTRSLVMVGFISHT